MQRVKLHCKILIVVICSNFYLLSQYLYASTLPFLLLHIPFLIKYRARILWKYTLRALYSFEPPFFESKFSCSIMYIWEIRLYGGEKGLQNIRKLVFGRCLVRILFLASAILAEDLWCFLQSLQANSGIVGSPRLVQGCFIPKPFLHNLDAKSVIK
jgi:hypothetical protein